MKKHLILGIITLFFAICLSIVAAYFSIIGLAALFAATYIPVIIMGIFLETGKIISTIFAHQYWHDPDFKLQHRLYLLSAIFALMLITAIGIFGFLSKGHLEQEYPLVQTEFVISQYNKEIDHLNEQNKLYKVQLNQLDSSIEVYFKNDRVTQGLAAREKQKPQRELLNNQLNENNKKILDLNTQIIAKQQETSEVTAKLGPVKYVAELFGWEDTGSAVRLIIFIIMWCFDPLAIVLILSGVISLNKYYTKDKDENQSLLEKIEHLEKTINDYETHNFNEQPNDIVEHDILKKK